MGSPQHPEAFDGSRRLNLDSGSFCSSAGTFQPSRLHSRGPGTQGEPVGSRSRKWIQGAAILPREQSRALSPRPRCSEGIYDPSVGVKATDCATQGNDACAVNSAPGCGLVPVPDSVGGSAGSPPHTSPLRSLLQSPAEVTSQPRAFAIPASDDARGL